MIRKVAARLRRIAGRARGGLTMRLGRIARNEPLSADWGFDRGQPIDRFYIARFLAVHAADIQGHVLEIAEDLYSGRFGQDRITRLDILSLKPAAGATIVGDLVEPATLPAGQLDCIICTQTLQLIYDVRLAVENLRRALRPGGVLLLTAPGITPVDRKEWKDGWYWSFTKPALDRLLSEAFSTVDIASHGNLRAATAFLHGAAVEDIGKSQLDPADEAFPVIVTARAVA